MIGANQKYQWAFFVKITAPLSQLISCTIIQSVYYCTIIAADQQYHHALCVNIVDPLLLHIGNTIKYPVLILLPLSNSAFGILKFQEDDRRL
jgi:hypothetical protein